MGVVKSTLILTTLFLCLGLYIPSYNKYERWHGNKRMKSFLTSVERQAYRMAEIGTGNSEKALDIVKDAMFRFVRKYLNPPDKDHE